MFDGFGKRAGHRRAWRWGRQTGRQWPLAAETLDGDDDPFDDEPQINRWLLTTCLAAVAGTLLVGGTVMGLFSEGGRGQAALASVRPAELWLRQLGAAKADLGGQTAQPAVLRSPFESDQMVIPARALSGALASQYPGISADLLPYASRRRPTVIDGSFEVASLSPANVTTIAKTPPPEPVDESITIEAGMNLAERLVDLGVTVETARLMVEAIEPVYPTRLLKPGQALTVTLDKQQDFYGNDVIYPVRLSFSPGPREEIVIEAEEDGRFVARIDGGERPRSRYVEAPHYVAGGKIQSSLYGTAIEEGVPEYIIGQIVQVFAFDVDFQRELRPDDEFEAFYGNPLTGSSTKRKVLHYTSLTVGGKKRTYYRFTTPDDGVTAYYDEDGRSANKFLMRTPANGARMTSSYGLRKHPLLGYTRMHTGVDFGLPYGTPIKAAGAGVVSLAGRAGAYGITVRIKHQKGYETVYAHMSRIANGIEPGSKVNQGQIIGYVGSSGRSTGPHLHYEVRVNGKPVNPMKVRAAGGRQLSGAMLAEFQKHKQKIIAMMNDAAPATRLAQVDQ